MKVEELMKIEGEMIVEQCFKVEQCMKVQQWIIKVRERIISWAVIKNWRMNES